MKKPKTTKLPPRELLDDLSLDLDHMMPEEDVYKEPSEWTIITALDRVLSQARGSQLSDHFWESVKNPIAYLEKELELTKFQIVFIAILIEAGEALSWKGVGRYLHCSRLSVMVYTDEVDDLVTKGWILHRGVHEMGGHFQGYALEHGVVTALRHNKPFVPEKINDLDIQEFVGKLEKRIDRGINDIRSEFSDDEEWMDYLCKANPHLPLCRNVMAFDDDIHVRSLLLLAVYDYAQWEGSEDEGMTSDFIDRLYPCDFEANDMREKLEDGTHPLIEMGLLEHKCEDGVADTNRFMLTRRCKEELLADYSPSHSRCRRRRYRDRNMKSHISIKAKDMFYNTLEQEQIARLTSLLSQDSLPSIQERLEKEGMRKGFACLFYGAPGTGKTETVLQIARQTGRDIMQIDIAGMRDKFVGESEKNLKAVFQRYREVCKHSDVMPILFFNEADGIFGKRVTIGGNNPSIEKMDNAMQNILLQELEDLDGILIATTNLTCNLDDAFERRFLFKVEFQKPDIDVKVKLWNSMLHGLSDDEAHKLAQRYDFSGGQIENIARKQTIDYILSGKRATFAEIMDYCQTEQLNNTRTPRRVGF